MIYEFEEIEVLRCIKDIYKLGVVISKKIILQIGNF